MTIGLIGYRGSGKTTVGKILAGKLAHTFVDVDERIVRRASRTIREIFEQSGETAFRDLETAAVREVCTLQNAVISFGGGAFDREENRRLISEAGLKVVYLQCEPATLLRRIEADPLTAAARPNLTALGGGIGEIQAVLARREPLWRELAGSEVAVTHLTAAEAACQIQAGLAALAHNPGQESPRNSSH